jgi:flagellar hook-associated protein 2
MPTRVTGMNSGLDTESLINELVKAKSYKVDNLKKDQQKLKWKQDAWKDLNKEIKSLFSGTISNLRYTSTFKKKTTAVSNSNAVSVITGSNAMNSVQSLSVKRLASSGYLTGQQIKSDSGSEVTKSSLLSELAIKDSNGNKIDGLAAIDGEGSFTVTTGGKSTKININADTKITDVVSQLNAAGVSANFDEKNGRIFIGAKESGKANDFAITADNSIGFSALSVLGINVDPSSEANAAAASQYAKYAELYSTYGSMDKETAINSMTSDVNSEIYKMLKAEVTDPDNPDYDAAYDKLMEKLQFASNAGATGNSAFYSSDAVKLKGDDALITLNGASFTSSSNTFEINGLTITCNAEAEDVVLTTKDDTDGMYDVVKDFLKKYNEIIGKLDKLYNADAAKGYEPLTDEEKSAMSDKDIENWENKIKESLFRKDSTLGTLFNSMKDIMGQGFEIGGKKMYLSDFGIGTMGYFEVPENERSLLHIDGDPDDSETSGKEDKLKSLIAADPDTVTSFFNKLASSLYDKMYSLQGSSASSSFGSFFDDKQIKTDLTDFESKINTAQQKLNDYEDMYYKKFSKMEVALSKLNSQTSYITGLFGGGQ